MRPCLRKVANKTVGDKMFRFLKNKKGHSSDNGVSPNVKAIQKELSKVSFAK